MPLAHTLRPKTIEQVVGQTHLTNKRSLFYRLLEASSPTSILFWGPPGCGKTTLAKIYSQHFEQPFYELSATSAPISEVKKIIDQNKSAPLFAKTPILFLDEIHRFNKLQQDTFLPLLEKGELILIGATTENPSFALNPALLSRLNVFILQPLEEQDLIKLIDHYEKQNKALPINVEAKHSLAQNCAGDARILYNLIEAIAKLEVEKKLTAKELMKLLPSQFAKYDQSGDGKYFLISALHKSMRGSDVDASLYWLFRMLIANEDPMYIFRRLLRFASEDIGLADPNAIAQVMQCRNAFEQVGLPEGEIFLAQSVIYLSLSPKSNSVYSALNKAKEYAHQSTQHSPPKHILNSPTKWMKNMGYGKGYAYDHELESGISGQEYFPEKLPRKSFYSPKEKGFERQMKKYLEYYNKIKAEKPYSSK